MPRGHPRPGRRPHRVYRRWPQILDSVHLVTGARPPVDDAEMEKLRAGDARLRLMLIHDRALYAAAGSPYWQTLEINRAVRHRVYRPDGSWTYTPYDRCRRGHWLTPDNTRVGPSGRQCYRCRIEQEQIRRARLRRRAQVEARLREAGLL